MGPNLCLSAAWSTKVCKSRVGTVGFVRGLEHGATTYETAALSVAAGVSARVMRQMPGQR